MKINLNELIKIKPTERGFQWIIDVQNQTITEYELPFMLHHIEDLKANADKDGYLTIMLWEFLNYFGGFGMSLDQYVGIEIIATRGFHREGEETLLLKDEFKPLVRFTPVQYWPVSGYKPGKLFRFLQNLFK